MQPSNNPDIYLAQEWIGHLDAYLSANGLRGYDPFDVKAHPWVRAAQTRPILRKATTALCDLFPYASRRALGVQPTENPKAFALVAIGELRMFQLGGGACLARALDRLAWLRANTAQGYAGACWGYPFPVRGTGVDTPAGTPVGVVSAIAGEAFLLAHEVTGDAAHLETARSIAEFVLRDLPRMEADDGSCCFGYTPGDRRRVHNANLLAAELLYRVGARTGEALLAEAAAPAVRFTLARQQKDGAWPYGECAPGDPYEPGLMRLVDNHHTGFVLRSLHGIHAVTGDDTVKCAIRSGFQCYRTLFTPIGMPVTRHAKFPADIHACAEGILCPAVLSDFVLGARPLSVLVLRWTHYYLRDRATHAPHYRKYPFFTSKLIAARWGLAWMYRAIAEYLFRFYAARNDEE